MILRPMTMADADKMLEWKNYPETRMFSIVSKEEIKKEDHYKYLEANLQYFQIIESHMDIVGAVRVHDNEISIWIDRTHWGKGIASTVIKMVSNSGSTAKIAQGNFASMSAFARNGFIPISYYDGVFTFKKY